VDLFELRVDHFSGEPLRLLQAAPRLGAPLIVTVRHPAEGGVGNLSIAQRRELYAQFLPVAKYVDVELRSVRQLAAPIAEARARGVKLIVSAHFFKSTPSLNRLEALRDRAFGAGADVFKVATLTRTLPEVLTLASLLVRSPRLPLSVMGMGKFGKLSRLLLASAGSVLNYGYLDAVQVPGQWPAPLLKERLSESA
jgi:3-dehydroquinate dehydratase-1